MSGWHKAQPAWDYLWSLFERRRGWIPYGWWLDGEVPSRDPAWAENSVVPDPDEIDTMFCASVGTLMIRALNMFDEGYVVPHAGNTLYDGGTVGYVHYYRSYGTLEPFDVNFAAYNSGTLCLREYRDANADQGHVMVSWRGMAVQTFPPAGLNYDYTVDQSHDGGYYEYMVKPWNWLPITQAEYYEEDDGDIPTPEPVPTDGTPLTVDLLVKSMTGNSFNGPDLTRDVAEKFYPHLIRTMRERGINNRERISAFLAQMGAESGSFLWMREFGRGEGKEFGIYYGRGIGQLTWSDNYRRYADDSGFDCWNNPEIVADDLFAACDSAGWHWNYKDLSALADQATWQAFYEITHLWWGITPPQPVHERDARYSVAWAALPADLVLPGDDGGDGEEEWLQARVKSTSQSPFWAYVEDDGKAYWLRGKSGDHYQAVEDGWLQHTAMDANDATINSVGAAEAELSPVTPPDFNARAYIEAKYGMRGADASPEYQQERYADKVEPAPRSPSDYVPKAPSFKNSWEDEPVTESTTKKPVEQREPAVTIAAVVGVLVSLLALAGITLSQEEVESFEIVLGVLLPIVSTLVAGIATRSRVTPVGKGSE